MTNKCRGAFEKDLTEKWGIKPPGFKNTFNLAENGKYCSNGVQAMWEEWQAAWNASHDRCYEIVDNKGLEFNCRTKKSTQEYRSCYQAKLLINNDKVKV